MSFEAQLQAFADKVERRSKDLHVFTTEEALDALTEGNALTGSPGQPVDTSALKNSYYAGAQHTGPWQWQSTSGLAYAEPIEEGVGRHGPMTLRSKVGGFHSIKLFRAGWQRVVDACAKKAAAT